MVLDCFFVGVFCVIEVVFYVGEFVCVGYGVVCE